MKSKLIATLVAGALAIPAGLVYAADAAKDTTTKSTTTTTRDTKDPNSRTAKAKEFVKDSAVTARVKAALAKEKMSTLVKINVDTTKEGEVTLTGSVPSKMDADKAESIAKRVNGVSKVENNLTVAAAK